MKTSSTELWHLIKSLSTAEKTYFKRNFTGLAAGEAAYLKLFDEIAGQKVYDEEKILAKLTGIISTKNISGQKTYLHKQITNALINYHNAKNDETDIYQQILLIRLYRSKGLLDMAYKTWKKAIAEARDTESYSLLTILKSEYEKMALFNTFQVENEESYSIFRGETSSYDNFIKILQLRDIYASVLQLKAKAHFDLSPAVKKKISIIEQRLEAENERQFAQSFWYQHYFLSSKATIYYLLGMAQEALTVLKRIFTLWKNNPQKISTNAEFFIEVMNMINYAGVACGNLAYVKLAFDDAIHSSIKDKTNKANFQTIRWITQSKIYHKTAQYNEVDKLVSVIKKEYKVWAPLLNAELNMTLQNSIAISCFVLENYEDAFYYCKNAFTSYRKSGRQESSAFTQIFLLLIHFEMNSERLFESQLKNTSSFFKRKKEQHPFEKIMINCLGKAFYLQSYEEKKALFESTLQKLEEKKGNKVQKAAFNIFNYPRWLQSKIERVTYRAYVESLSQE